jgi:hypothetical protein
MRCIDAGLERRRRILILSLESEFLVEVPLSRFLVLGEALRLRVTRQHADVHRRLVVVLEDG